MTIAMTGAGSALGRELVHLLAAEHELLILDPGPPPEPVGRHLPSVEGSLEELAAALAGVDAVIHGALLATGSARGLEAGQGRLDVAGRVTYNLVMAAAQAGVRRFLLVSTLAMHADYDHDLILQESFRPLPTTDPEQLAYLAAETVCNEAGRELDIRTRIVRLGTLVLEEEVAGQEFDPFWVDRRDAAAALKHLATHTPEGRGRGRGGGWRGPGVIHVCADRPDSAASMGRLARWLEFEPQHRFEACPARAEVAG